MAGILDPGMLEQGGGGLFGSLFAPIANNQNAILGYLAGALQGGGLGESIGRGLQGWVGGSQADQARGAQRAAMKYAAQNPDIDPALKQALVQNPALAMQYLTARAKPTEFKFEKAGQLYGGFNPQTGRFSIQGASPEFQKAAPGETGSYVTPPVPAAGLPGTATPALSGGPEKPPAGYQYVDPQNPTAGLSAIAGGPATHVPAEVGGRVALMEQSLKDFKSARGELERQWGLGDRIMASINAGDIGRAQRTVRVGIEATLRAMTGAAAPEEEVKRYADMFMPSQLDSPQTAKQKLDLLENFMRDARRTILQGRTPTGDQGNAPAFPGGRGYKILSVR